MLTGVPWLMWAIAIVSIIAAAMIPVAIAHKPKQITYLSPLAYEERVFKIESDRRDAIEAATSQESIDLIEESYDELLSKIAIKEG